MARWPRLNTPPLHHDIGKLYSKLTGGGNAASQPKLLMA